MHTRKATKEDIQSIIRMAEDFKNASPYKDIEFDAEKVKVVIGLMLEATEGFCVFVAEDNNGNLIGMLGGMCGTPLLFSNELVASEVVWWVDPNHRNNNVGVFLKTDFEQWAKEKGCKMTTMVLLEDENINKIDAMYKQFGYVPSERTYFRWPL